MDICQSIEGYGPDGQGFKLRHGTRTFSFPSHLDRSVCPPTPVLNGLSAYLPGMNSPGSEVDLSTPSSAEI
jgi:hypothetical protein